jgi:hypothetical protein
VSKRSFGQGNEAVAEEIFAPQVIEGDGRQLSTADLCAAMRGMHAAAPDGESFEFGC